MSLQEYNPNDISVYIHIPFCIKIRRGENTLLVDSTREIRNDYLEALERELMSAGDILANRRIVSIHIGGGIATTVSPDRLARMMIRFKRAYSIAPRAEISITAAPQTLVTPCLSSLNMFNINRISMVAYSPVDSLLETIDASHRLSDIETGSAMLVKFGFQDIDTLLLYGIPGQTLTTLRNTLLAFSSVKGFHHITLKPYELSNQSGVRREERDEQYRHAVEVLKSRGLIQYTTDSFATKTNQNQNLLQELLGVERIGFGLGARSFVDGYIYQNTINFYDYLKNSGNFSELITNVTKLRKKDKIKRFIAHRLQLVDGFSEEEFTQTFNNPPEKLIPQILAKLEKQELIESTERRIKPTFAGLMHSDEMITSVLEEE